MPQPLALFNRRSTARHLAPVQSISVPPQHVTTLKDVPFSPAYDRASFDEFVEAATATIDTLHHRIEAAQARCARLQGDRAAHRDAQADLGLRVIRAQLQLEQERRDRDDTVRGILAAADQAASAILAEVRAEVRSLRAALDEIGVAPEGGMGQLLRFRAHWGDDIAPAGEHPDEARPIAPGCPDDGPAGPVAAIS